MKLKFNNLSGLFRRRHKLPFLDGILASLNEQGVSPDDSRALHTSSADDNFDLTLPYVHSFCEVRNIGASVLTCAWIHPSNQTVPIRSARKNERRSVATANFFHRLVLIDRYSSLDWKMPRVREGTSGAMAERCGVIESELVEHR